MDTPRTYNLLRLSSTQDVLGAISGDFKSIHVSASMTQLARLDPRGDFRSDPRFGTFMERVASCSDDLDTHALSTVIYVLGKLKIFPQERWLAEFFKSTEHRLWNFDSQGLSNVLWACAGLNFKPSVEWMEAFWESAVAVSNTAEPRHLSNMLWASASLKLKPAGEFLGSVFDRIQEFDAHSLSNTLWALNTISVEPPVDFFQRFWDRYSQLEPNAQDSSNAVWASAHMGHHPPDFAWSIMPLETFTPQNFSNAIWACAKLSSLPLDPWLVDFFEASRLKVAQMSPQNISIILWSVAKLGLQPPSDWMCAMVSRCDVMVAQFDSQAISNLVWSFASFGLPPPSRLLFKKLWSTAMARDRFGDAELAQLLHASVFANMMGMNVVWTNPKLKFDAMGSAKKMKKLDRHSRSESLVSEMLQKNGTSHRCSVECPKTGRCIDIVIQGNTAVEVDGPMHFVHRVGQPGLFPNGTTILRNRTLAAAGWNVVSVPLVGLNRDGLDGFLRTLQTKRKYDTLMV